MGIGDSLAKRKGGRSSRLQIWESLERKVFLKGKRDHLFQILLKSVGKGYAVEH